MFKDLYDSLQRICGMFSAMAFLLTVILVFAVPKTSAGFSDVFQATDETGTVWLHDITACVETHEGVFKLNDPRYEISMREEPVDDAFGSQPWTVVEATDSPKVSWTWIGVYERVI